MAAQNLNAWVDAAPVEIVEKYRLGEHDKNTYLLNAAHIREHEYFCQRSHEDMV